MSATPVWCELVCAVCASTTSGRFTYSTIPRREMVAAAKQRGWRLRNGDCICKRCADLEDAGEIVEDDENLGGEWK